MLDAEIHKKICEFVKSKPRTVQEIAEHIKKNWRTAERYVERISEETGCVLQLEYSGKEQEGH